MAGEKWGVLSLEQGSVAVVARDNRLIRICFKCSSDDVFTSIKRYYPDATQSPQLLIQNGLQQLTEYFHGKRRTFQLPLDNDALTSFSCKVQQELLKVPFGSVVSYGELAKLSGSPNAARAIGTVMSSNPFPLVVPCHRVVNSDGRIGQYSAAHGTSTKSWLIEFESMIAGTSL